MKKHTFVALTVLAFSLFFLLLTAYSDQSLILKRVSNAFDDVLFKVRYSSEPLPASREKLLVVAIDDESSFRLGLRWPWPRAVFARIVEELARKEAAVIGLNFTFTGLEGGKEDTTQALADAIASHGHVVVGSTLSGERLIRPNDLLLKAGVRYGYVEKIVDDDFVIRRAYPSRSDKMRVLEEPSFPLALRKESGKPSPKTDQGEKGEAIDYLLKPGDLTVLSAWKILDGHVPREAIKGKTALVGITSSLMSEEHRTPLGLLSGVAVHANEWVAWEEGRRLREVPLATGAFLGWLTGAVLLFLFLQKRAWLAVLGFAAGLFLMCLIAQNLFATDLRVPLFILTLGPVLALATGIAANLLWLWLENRGLAHRMLHDKMTGLYTYDYLRMRLDDEWKHCLRLQVPVSVVMTDLDRFKKINDVLGHETGNKMILHAASVIRESARGYDVVSRYGGDEFVILLWHATPAEAKAYRDRLRALYTKQSEPFEEPMLKNSSMSIGVASFDPRSGEGQPATPQELIERADKDLFEDKESRRKPGEERR